MVTRASNNEYPKREGAKPGRVDLLPKEFENAIEDQGTMVRITPVALCPNRTDIADTNHVLDCPLCFGDQVIELSKDCIEDWAIIQGIKLDKRFEVNGVFDMKDATITVRQGVRLYYWYKIEVLDFASVFNEVVKRGNDVTDDIRYNPAKACDTPFHCIDSSGKQYTVGKHYEIEDYSLRWITPERPESGKLYSLVYPILPTFRVIEVLHENRYYYTGFKQKTRTPVNLPQQALIRWDYIANRSGSGVLR